MTDRGPALYRCEQGHAWQVAEYGGECPSCHGEGVPTQEAKRNKYRSERTWSEVCQRWFASKLEARRGDYLWGLQLKGAIDRLRFQVRFRLSVVPGHKVSYVADFEFYIRESELIYTRRIEDTKGVLTAAARVKLAWMQSLGNPVTIIREGDW